MKTFILIISFFLLTSCNMTNENNTKDATIAEPAVKIVPNTTQSGVIEIKTSTTSSGRETFQIGSGFILSSDYKTLDLSYSGKVIKKWEYSFNDFVLGNSCTSDENEWKTFSQEKKKTCTKSHMIDSIGVNQLNNRIFWITQSAWESQLSWVYDTESGNFQELNQYLIALIPQVKITNNHIYLVIEEGQSIGVQHLLVYDKNFSKELTEWPKNNENFVIDDVEELSPTSIKIKAHDFGEPGVPGSIKKSEHTISIK